MKSIRLFALGFWGERVTYQETCTRAYRWGDEAVRAFVYYLPFLGGVLVGVVACMIFR